MKKQTLNEEVSRIKGMMKSINENWFGKPAPGESIYERFLERWDDELRNLSYRMRKVKYSDLQQLPEETWNSVVDEITSTYGEDVLSQIEHWIAVGHLDEREIARYAVSHMDKTGTETQMVIYAMQEFLDGIGFPDERDEDSDYEDEDSDETDDYDDEEEDDYKDDNTNMGGIQRIV